MVNILLEHYKIDDELFFKHFNKYITPEKRVLVVAFSFRDSRVRDNGDWQNLYGKGLGKLYDGITGSFMSYGIKEENIEFLNYFEDTKASAEEKVGSADILYFLGGLPDRMYERLVEFELTDVLAKHNGVVIGYSAGAVIQLTEYHLSPDEDYTEFSYYNGIPYLNNFYIQPHYENTASQNDSIKKVLAEKRKTVYAMHHNGAIIVDDGEVELIGDIEVFYP